MAGVCPVAPGIRPDYKIDITCAGVTTRVKRPTLPLMGEWDHRPLVRYLDAAMDAAEIRTDAELARLADIKQQQLSSWRRGVRPSPRLLSKVAAALGVPARDLYGLAGWSPADDGDGTAPLPLPQELRDLVDLYVESGRTDEERETIRAHIRVAVSGLRAMFGETEVSPVRSRRAG